MNKFDDIEEIELGDKFMRPVAWITSAVSFFRSLPPLAKGDYTSSAIFLTLALIFFVFFMSMPKEPKKIVINTKSKIIDVVNHFPRKNLQLNLNELSKVEWEGGRDIHSRVGIYFVNKKGKIVFSFVGHAAVHKPNIDSIEYLPKRYQDLLRIMNSLIKENSDERNS